MKTTTTLAAIAALLGGCTFGDDQQLAQMQKEINDLRADVSGIKQHMEKEDASRGDWVMTSTSRQVGFIPRTEAIAAYSNKEECLTAAGSWSIPGGELVSNDPVILRNKKTHTELQIVCLPRGVK